MMSRDWCERQHQCYKSNIRVTDGKAETLIRMLNNWVEPEAKGERTWPENSPALRKVGIAVERIASR